MRQPNSGRIGRSPGAVASTIRIASSSSWSRETSAIDPVASVRMGNAAQPDPTNSSAIPLSLLASVDLHDAALEAGHAAAFECERSPLDLCLRRALDRDPARALEREVGGRFDGHVGVALDLDVLRAVDLHLPALRVDGDD